MTRRALDLIAAADAILYDRLIPPGALDGARAGRRPALRRQAARRALDEQDEINALLVELGQAGKSVVRLKGGDPFVFGRGGEEARGAGGRGRGVRGRARASPPGVAAPAYAGIPVTHRDAASAVAFVTGHEDPDEAGERSRLGRARAFPGTLVLYMGVKNLPQIAERLIAAGRPESEPAAVVERGTLPGQRAVRRHARRHRGARARPRSSGRRRSRVVGPVARLRERLAWIESRPLHGRSVAVTRARAQASGLAARLRALGARGGGGAGDPDRAAAVAGEVDRDRRAGSATTRSFA